MAELAAVWDRLAHSRARCIILTGAGERAFSAGADMRGDLSADPETARIVWTGHSSAAAAARVGRPDGSVDWTRRSGRVA